MKSRRVRVANYASLARTDIVTTVIPFAQGEWRGEPLSVKASESDKFRLQYHKMGPTWPDGSFRTARVHIPVVLQANETQELEIVQEEGQEHPFILGTAVNQAAMVDGFSLVVNEVEETFLSWKEIESGHLIKHLRSRIRVPGTAVWAELHLQVMNAQNHTRFLLHYGTSDDSPNSGHQVDEVVFQVRGPGVELYHSKDKEQSRTEGGDLTAIQLMYSMKWAEGQSQAVSGVFTWKNIPVEKEIPVLAVSLDWAESGAWGPWGVVPETPTGLSHQAIRNRFEGDYAKQNATAGSWAWGPHAASPQPTSAGRQGSHGTRLMIAAANGHLMELWTVHRSVQREACRPGHFREDDGSPRALSKYPEYLSWQGQPHMRYQGANKPFQLMGETFGKVEPSNTYATTAYPSSAQRWATHDLEHWCPGYTSTLALMTGDLFALLETDRLTEAWLAENRVEPTTPGGKQVGGTAGMGESRGIGRTLREGINLWLVHGREDLEERILARVQVAKRDWTGANTSPVRPVKKRKPAGKQLYGTYDFFMPWQDVYAQQGLDAVSLQLGDGDAAELAWLIGKNTVTYGWTNWWFDANKGWLPSSIPWPCKAVRWIEGGRELTESEQLETRQINGVTKPVGQEIYTAYTIQMLSGVALTREMARVRGDQAILARCDEIWNAHALAQTSWEFQKWAGAVVPAKPIFEEGINDD